MTRRLKRSFVTATMLSAALVLVVLMGIVNLVSVLDRAGSDTELLQYLASVAAGIAEPVETSPEPENLPGGSIEDAYDLFMAEHALVWMPRFAAKTAEVSRTPFFRAAGVYLAAVLTQH